MAGAGSGGAATTTAVTTSSGGGGGGGSITDTKSQYRYYRDLDGLEVISHKTNVRLQSGSALTPYRVMELYTPPQAKPFTASQFRSAAVELCRRHVLLRCRVVVTAPPPTPKRKSSVTPSNAGTAAAAATATAATPKASDGSDSSSPYAYFEEDLRFAPPPTDKSDTSKPTSGLEDLIPLEEVECSGADAGAMRQTLTSIIHERVMNATVPFPSDASPLIRLIWIRPNPSTPVNGGTGSALIMGVPHLICDGLCLAPLADQFFTILEAVRAGTSDLATSAVSTPTAYGGLGLPRAFPIRTDTQLTELDRSGAAELATLKQQFNQLVSVDLQTKSATVSDESVRVKLLVAVTALYDRLCAKSAKNSASPDAKFAPSSTADDVSLSPLLPECDALLTALESLNPLIVSGAPTDQPTDKSSQSQPTTPRAPFVRRSLSSAALASIAAAAEAAVAAGKPIPPTAAAALAAAAASKQSDAPPPPQATGIKRSKSKNVLQPTDTVTGNGGAVAAATPVLSSLRTGAKSLGTALAQVIIPSDQLNSLLSMSRRNGVTLHGTLCAALLIAQYDRLTASPPPTTTDTKAESKPASGSEEKWIGFDNAASFRGRELPALTREQLLFAAWAFRVYVPVSPAAAALKTSGFWGLAKRAHSEVHTRVNRHAAMCDVIRHCNGTPPLIPEKHRKFVLQISNAGPSGIQPVYGVAGKSANSAGDNKSGSVSVAASASTFHVNSFYAVARMHPFAVLFVHITSHANQCVINVWYETPTISQAVANRFTDVIRQTLSRIVTDGSQSAVPAAAQTLSQ